MSFNVPFGGQEDKSEELAEAPIKKSHKRGQLRHCTEGRYSRCFMRTQRNEYRRCFSESKLLDLITEDFKDGESWHFLTAGDIDSLSFLKIILRQQDLDYLMLSTWCMADDDVLQLREWLKAGKIKRLDCYMGEIFPGSYKSEYATLQQVIEEFTPSERIAVFRNHSKIFAGTGKKYDFGIESSANINTNPRNENACITIGHDIFMFYKEFYDKIKSFTKDYPNWQPWTPKKS